MKIKSVNQPLFEVRQKRQVIYLPPEMCTQVGLPTKIRENKRLMLDIRKSMFQQPHERIQSIIGLNKMISESKQAKEWDLEFNVQPDEIEAKILKRPQILDPYGGEYAKSLEDTRVLSSAIHEPVNFKKWAIFCLEQDAENGKYLQDKFYSMSQAKGLNIAVEFSDMVKLRRGASIKEFKDAIDGYYQQYVAPDVAAQKKSKKAGERKDLFFFLIIIPYQAK